MGYSIVFENKYIKLSDGRYIHFESGGCNNDIVSCHRDGVRYRRVIEHPDVKNENKLVELIENHEPMTFYIKNASNRR